MKDMRRLGIVIASYGTSCIIIKSDDKIDHKDLVSLLNKKVIDRNIDSIGKIISIFGSKKQLYFLAKINIKKNYSESITDYINCKIYIKN